MVAASLLLPIQKAPSSKIPFIPNTSKHVAAGDCEVRPIHGEKEDGYHSQSHGRVTVLTATER